MSLAVPSDGLLSTHVTWEEVEKLLAESLKTKANMGAKKSITHIGEGNGFMSRIGLITCDWEDANEDEKLPTKIALKMSTLLASRAMADKMENDFKLPDMADEKGQLQMLEGWQDFVKETHNTEVDVYRFLSHLGGDLTVPECYYSVPFSAENMLAGSLALEYFDNSKVIHVHETMTVDQVKQIARALGKIHTASVRYGVDKEPSLSRDTWSKFWSKLQQEMLVQMMQMAKRLDETLVEPIDAALHLLPEYFGTNLVMTIHEQIGCGRVLVNGDHWSANVLFDATTGDLRAIIDWQIAHAGVGVEDLLRISMSGLSSADRRSHMSDILNEIYDSMEKHLDGTPAPYSRETMFKLYEILLPHTAFFFAPILTPVFASTIDAAESEEEKGRRREVIVDKIRAIYEDIAVYHEKNQKRGLEFKWKAN